MSSALAVRLVGGECARRRYAHCFHTARASERTIARRKLWRANSISVETAMHILLVAAATPRGPSFLEGADFVLVVTFDAEGQEELELAIAATAARQLSERLCRRGGDT